MYVDILRDSYEYDYEEKKKVPGVLLLTEFIECMIPKQNDAIVKILKRTTDLYLKLLQHKRLAVHSFGLALLHNNSELINLFLPLTRSQVLEEEVIEVIKSAY